MLCLYGLLSFAGNVGANHAIFAQGASASNEMIVEKKGESSCIASIIRSGVATVLKFHIDKI